MRHGGPRSRSSAGSAPGNLIGQTGPDRRVNALDPGRIEQQPNSASDITGRFDFNRDGRVNALDLGIAKANLNRGLAAPAAPAAPVPPGNLTTEGTIRRLWDEPETPVI